MEGPLGELTMNAQAVPEEDEIKVVHVRDNKKNMMADIATRLNELHVELKSEKEAKLAVTCALNKYKEAVKEVNKQFENFLNGYRGEEFFPIVIDDEESGEKEDTACHNLTENWNTLHLIVSQLAEKQRALEKKLADAVVVEVESEGEEAGPSMTKAKGTKTVQLSEIKEEWKKKSAELKEHQQEPDVVGGGDKKNCLLETPVSGPEVFDYDEVKDKEKRKIEELENQLNDQQKIINELRKQKGDEIFKLKFQLEEETGMRKEAEEKQKENRLLIQNLYIMYVNLLTALKNEEGEKIEEISGAVQKALLVLNPLYDPKGSVETPKKEKSPFVPKYERPRTRGYVKSCIKKEEK